MQVPRGGVSCGAVGCACQAFENLPPHVALVIVGGVWEDDVLGHDAAAHVDHEAGAQGPGLDDAGAADGERDRLICRGSEGESKIRPCLCFVHLSCSGGVHVQRREHATLQATHQGL